MEWVLDIALQLHEQKAHGCTEALKTADKINVYWSKTKAERGSSHKDPVHIKLFFKLRKWTKEMML